MIENVKRFLASSVGQIFGIAVSVALVCLGIFVLESFIRGDTPEDAFYKTYIDTETGKPFRHENKMGESLPILAPSGKNTGMPAEACFWTADGSIQKEPTWVLLNSEVGKPEPTFCPACGRLVVGHNPWPSTGAQPPPTRAEWFARHQPRE